MLINKKSISDTSSIKIISIVGHCFFLVYFLFSAFYYLERTIPFDGAFYCFKIIHFNTFNIENGRWGAFHTQLLPLLGLYSGCTLKTFLFLYSISFAIWNYLFFIIILHLIKKPLISLAFILSLVLAYRHSFFYPVSEIHSTIGPLFLFFSILELYKTELRGISVKRNALYVLLLVLNALWIAKIHLIAVFAITFIIVYSAIEKWDKRSLLKFVTTSLFSLGIFLLFILLIPKNSYDGSKMLSLNAFKTLYNDIHNTYGFNFFVPEFHRNYYLLTFLLVSSLIVLVLQKKILKGFLLLSSVVGFWLVIMAYTINADSPVNLQNYYCYLGLIIAIPLATDVLKISNRSFFTLSVIAILTHGYYKIIKSGLRFTDRTDYITRCVNNFKSRPESKFIVSENNFNKEILWAYWDLGFESLFLSSLNSPDSSVTFYGVTLERKIEELCSSEKNVFLGPSFAPIWFGVKDINSHSTFFHLKDCLYKNANTLQDKNFNDSLFNNENLAIQLNGSYSLLRNETRSIPLRIENKSDQIFCSSPSEEKKLRLSYHILDKNNKVIEAEGYRTPIEIDIAPHSVIESGLSLNLKDIARGDYILEVDIVHENKRWFLINKRTHLTIY